MSRSLFFLLALAAAGSAFAQPQTSPLDALEMDVLNPGEKPDQALERMAAKPRQNDHTPADAAALEERPISPAADSKSFGSAPLHPGEGRDILPSQGDRAQEHRHDEDRHKERDGDKADRGDGDRQASADGPKRDEPKKDDGGKDRDDRGKKG